MQCFIAKTPYFLLKNSDAQKCDGVCWVEKCFFFLKFFFL